MNISHYTFKHRKMPSHTMCGGGSSSATKKRKRPTHAPKVPSLVHPKDKNQLLKELIKIYADIAGSAKPIVTARAEFDNRFTHILHHYKEWVGDPATKSIRVQLENNPAVPSQNLGVVKIDTVDDGASASEAEKKRLTDTFSKLLGRKKNSSPHSQNYSQFRFL